jgi:CCR4-NOT transcription complex subunit 2
MKCFRYSSLLYKGSSKHIGTKSDTLASSQWAQGRNNVAQLQKNGRDTEQDGNTATSSPPQGSDPYGLLGLLGVIRMTDPDRSMLALGSDLTTLGLDLNTAE